MKVEEMGKSDEQELRRRLGSEFQVGFARYVAKNVEKREGPRWLAVNERLAKSLDWWGAATGKAETWVVIFLRGLARRQNFLLAHHGAEGIPGWARAVAEVFRFTEPDLGGAAIDLARRFGKQADFCRSTYNITILSPDFTQVKVSQCGIWRHNQDALNRGAAPCMADPCFLCTSVTTACAQAKEISATHQLNQNGKTHGCRWEFRTPHPRR